MTNDLPDFYNLFQTHKSGTKPNIHTVELTTRLNALETIPKENRLTEIKDIQDKLSLLQQQFNDATIHLPSYDQRQIQLVPTVYY
jgi:hypothetical protein